MEMWFRFYLHVIKRLPIVCPIIEHLQHLFKYIIGRYGIKQGHAGTNLHRIQLPEDVSGCHFSMCE